MKTIQTDPPENENNETKTTKTKKTIVSYIQNFAQKNPKRTWQIMISLTLLSITTTTIKYYYAIKAPPIKIETKKIVNDAPSSLSSPIKLTEKIMEMKEILKELQYYKTKQKLTKEDTIRIKYLLDKIKKLKDEE